MFDVFEAHLKASSPFSADEIALVRSLSVSKHLKKRQYLQQSGDICRFHTFVCTGCLRSYRIGNDGTEYIMGFSAAGNWMNDEVSLSNGLPSDQYIDALEDTDIIQLSVENFRCLVRDIPNFSALHNRIATINASHTQDRIYLMISQQAEDRYRHFVDHFPQLCHRIPLFMIASYLGVARETLTRIRGSVLDR